MCGTGNALFRPRSDWYHNNHEPVQHEASDEVGVFAWSKIMVCGYVCMHPNNHECVQGCLRALPFAVNVTVPSDGLPAKKQVEERREEDSQLAETNVSEFDEAPSVEEATCCYHKSGKYGDVLTDDVRLWKKKATDCEKQYNTAIEVVAKFVNEMVKGVLKERGLMPARDRARSSALSHTSLSGGEGQMVRARRLSVNLRGAAFETPGNRWSVALPGHYRRDGCRLRLTRPHVLKATCGAAAAVGLQDTQPRGYHLQVSLAAASASPEHTWSNTPTLGASAGRARREWKGAGLRTAAGTGWWNGWWTGADAGRGSSWRRGVSTLMGTDQGVNWWKGVKGRDGEDGTSEQGTRSKGQPQAGALQLPGNDAAIGGGSTSEGMDEQ
jgi:hypothetical protein